jgi:hypothetical protein
MRICQRLIIVLLFVKLIFNVEIIKALLTKYIRNNNTHLHFFVC